MTMLHKIDAERRLYVTKHSGWGESFSCKGFDNLEADGAAIYRWFIREAPRGIMECSPDYIRNAVNHWTHSTPGTEGRYHAYESLYDAGARFNRETGKRCGENLTPQLIGLEGH